MSVVYPGHGNYGNVVIGGAGGVSGIGAHTISISGGGSGYPSSVLTATGTGATTWASGAKTTARGKLNLEGDDADIIMNGVSLKEILNGITDRLAILQPKPDMLEKYDNLREAYEHYKTLEALLYDDQEHNK